MTTETRYAVPYVSVLNWVVNPLKNNTPITNTDGSRSQLFLSDVDPQTQLQSPFINMTTTAFIAGENVDNLTYKFSGEAYESLESSLSSIVAAWANAFSEVLDDFAVTAEQQPNATQTGLPYYLRLDRWDVNFSPDSRNDVKVLMGIYKDSACTQVTAYKTLTFLDGQQLRERDTRKTNLQASIAALVEAPSTPETDTQLKYQRAELARLEKAESVTGALTELLANPSVQQSVAQLCAILFSALTTIDPKWANIDVPALMQLFTLPDIA